VKLLLVVACALIDSDNRVLVAQRPQGKALAGLWEFPGGKLEQGERPEPALIRELSEELGITAANIDSFATSTNPDVQRFLGRSGDLGQMLGLPNNWTVNVIKAVGNYGEIWERNMTPIGFPRGPNNLWNNGGLQYAPPMR
jgi:8-oxo-dGTP pyrophosphatase MutT (NUDIX family)